MTGEEGLHPCRSSASVGVRVGNGLLHVGISLQFRLYLCLDVLRGECSIDWENTHTRTRTHTHREEPSLLMNITKIRKMNH